MAGSAANVRAMRAIGVLCRHAGLRVLEAAGWENRGRPRAPLRPEHVVTHHTAMTRDVDAVLIDGRADLPGPLCNFSLHADGTVVLIASGLANHAGAATISSEEAYGIEATGPIPLGNTGPDAFPQYPAYVTLVAAIRVHHGWGNQRVTSHKEIARPLGRKVDPAFDMTAFRAAVERRVRAWDEEDDMTPQEFEDAMVAALTRFVEPGGVIPGQNHWTDFGRVLADREARTIEAQQETNAKLDKVAAAIDQLASKLPPPPV